VRLLGTNAEISNDGLILRSMSSGDDRHQTAPILSRGGSREGRAGSLGGSRAESGLKTGLEPPVGGIRKPKRKCSISPPNDRFFAFLSYGGEGKSAASSNPAAHPRGTWGGLLKSCIQRMARVGRSAGSSRARGFFGPRHTGIVVPCSELHLVRERGWQANAQEIALNLSPVPAEPEVRCDSSGNRGVRGD
jgi:hypothetical protein